MIAISGPDACCAGWSGSPAAGPLLTVLLSAPARRRRGRLHAPRAHLQDLRARAPAPGRGLRLRYIEYAEEFGELEDIVMVVEARSFEGATAYAARLVQELRARRSSSSGSPTASTPSGSRAASSSTCRPTELNEIRDKIFDHQEFMESFAGDPSLARLLEGVNTQMAAAFVSNLFDLGLRTRTCRWTRASCACSWTRSARRLERPAPYRSPWGTLFSFGEDRPRRGLLPLRRQEPALHPGGDPAQREGQLHGRPGAPSRAIRGAIARLQARLPQRAGGRDRRRPRCPTTR